MRVQAPLGLLLLLLLLSGGGGGVSASPSKTAEASPTTDPMTPVAAGITMLQSPRWEGAVAALVDPAVRADNGPSNVFGPTTGPLHRRSPSDESGSESVGLSSVSFTLGNGTRGYGKTTFVWNCTTQCPRGDRTRTHARACSVHRSWASTVEAWTVAGTSSVVCHATPGAAECWIDLRASGAVGPLPEIGSLSCAEVNHEPRARARLRLRVASTSAQRGGVRQTTCLVSTEERRRECGL